MTKTFGTTTRQLLALADWLRDKHVSHVAMESTGVYWKPVYNLLEDTFSVYVVNARHIKAVPGRKTDVKDAEWIAELLQHGLLQPSVSFPTAHSANCVNWCAIAEAWPQERSREANRLSQGSGGCQQSSWPRWPRISWGFGPTDAGRLGRR